MYVESQGYAKNAAMSSPQRGIVHNSRMHFFLLFIIFISIWYLWKTCSSHWYSDFWFWSIVRRFFSLLSLKLFFWSWISSYCSFKSIFFCSFVWIQFAYTIFYFLFSAEISHVSDFGCINSIRSFVSLPAECEVLQARSPDSHRTPWRRRNTFTRGTTSQPRIDCCVDVAADDDEVRI